MRQLGKYTLIAPIASGGMAEVWRAEVAGPAGFVKQVALKLVRADRDDDDELVRMFIREARLASALHHQNIVHVFDFDRIDGRYLIAMELVHGKSLREVLARCRERNVRLGLARSLQVALSVARALAYAHRPVAEGGVAGLVHRDVSPHNILVSFEGEVKLTDFGIARAEDAAGQTRPGTLQGKVGYMAPEQARGGPVDARADLFALGVVLWELCTGRPLFARESEAATLAAVTGGGPISPPSSWNESVPPELDALVLAALERDPERRTRSADEMAAGLAEISLRVARTADEGDLRPLMRRLWPAEPPSRAGPAEAAPGAEELPAPVAADGVAGGEGADGGEGGAGGEGGRPGERVGEGTRTWRPVETSRRTGRGVLPMAAGALALVLAAALAWRWGWVPGSPSPRPPPPAAAAPADSAPRATAPAATAPAATAPADPADRRHPPVDPAPAPAPSPAAAAAAVEPGGRAPSAATPPRERAPAAPSRPVVRAASDGLGGLPLPPPESREGLLFVNAEPWAHVTVDGVTAGETPRELRLAAGLHRVRLAHPTLGAVEQTVRVKAGERVRLEIPLKP